MDTNLIKKIFAEIEKNPQQKDKDISVQGYSDDEVDKQLTFLYKRGYIVAEPIIDESNTFIKYLVGDITPSGYRFLESL